MTARIEQWVKSDPRGTRQVASIDVAANETLVVSYELAAQVLTQLGFVKEEETAA